MLSKVIEVIGTEESLRKTFDIVGAMHKEHIYMFGESFCNYGVTEDTYLIGNYEFAIESCNLLNKVENVI